MDSGNYIDNSIRLSIIEFLFVTKKDPVNYYVDSECYSRNDTLFIALYHTKGLRLLKELEMKNETNRLRGNPGDCGTILFSIRKKKVLSFLSWM
jgi:hypothetical protein